MHRNHAYTRGCCDSPFGWTGFKETETSQGLANISQHIRIVSFKAPSSEGAETSTTAMARWATGALLYRRTI